jgi:DNA-binding XRE family transcriptional regulator
MTEVTRIYPQWGQAPEPLWREVLGSRLRALRTEREETLSGTAERAGISPQYLSEIERGRKEPSSEMIAALAACPPQATGPPPATASSPEPPAPAALAPASPLSSGRPHPRSLSPWQPDAANRPHPGS